LDRLSRFMYLDRRAPKMQAGRLRQLALVIAFQQIQGRGVFLDYLQQCRRFIAAQGPALGYVRIAPWHRARATGPDPYLYTPQPILIHLLQGL